MRRNRFNESTARFFKVELEGFGDLHLLVTFSFLVFYLVHGHHIAKQPVTWMATEVCSTSQDDIKGGGILDELGLIHGGAFTPLVHLGDGFFERGSPEELIKGVTSLFEIGRNERNKVLLRGLFAPHGGGRRRKRSVWGHCLV